MSVRCDRHPESNHEPWQCPGGDPDVEMVRDELRTPFQGKDKRDAIAALSRIEERLEGVEIERADFKANAERLQSRLSRAEAVVETAKTFTKRYRYRPETDALRAALSHYEEER